MIVFSVIELIFYVKSASKTKHYVYSILKLLCCVLLGIYVAVALGSNSMSSSNIASIFTSIAFVVFLLAFVIEIILSTKDRCFGGSNSKVKNKNNEDVAIMRSKTSDKIAVLR